MTQNPFSRPSPDPTEPAPGGPVRRPDPGSPTVAWIAGLIATVCLVAVVYLNQVSKPQTSIQKAASSLAQQRSAVDISDPYTLSLKMVMKLSYLFDAKDKSSRDMLVGQSESPMTDPSRRPEAEKVREAIARAEIVRGEAGAKAADEMFRKLEAEYADRPDKLARALEEDEQQEIDDALKDMQTLRRIYAGELVSVNDADRQRLRDRHGWFADVAMTFGKEDSDVQRIALLSGGLALMLGICFILLAGFVAVVGGLGCFVAMVILISSGKVRRRFVAPAPGGSFGWEILAVFLAAFLGFKAVASLVAVAVSKDGTPPEWFATAVLLGQWSIALVVFFPLLRGVPFGEFRRLVGWTAPRGVWREIAAGVFGYFAGLPLVFGALLVSLALNVLMQKLSGHEAGPPENPILELAGRGTTLVLLLLFTLAAIWAPIVEETVFRGGLFRALRARMGFVLAAIVSALVFGFMHGYPVQLLGPVIMIGFVFALMREWRGSIVGPMVGHFLNNATILAIVFLILRAVA